jgi:hypothetical protein
MQSSQSLPIPRRGPPRAHGTIRTVRVRTQADILGVWFVIAPSSQPVEPLANLPRFITALALSVIYAELYELVHAYFPYLYVVANPWFLANPL